MSAAPLWQELEGGVVGGEEGSEARQGLFQESGLEVTVECPPTHYIG